MTLKPTDEMRDALKQATCCTCGHEDALPVILRIAEQQIRATPCARRRGTAPVDGCPCVNCTLARPEPPFCPVASDACPGDANGTPCTQPCFPSAREAS